VDYIIDFKGNDNVLMFYATSRIASDFTKYEQANVTYAMRANYPGDDYVDAIGFDCYDNLTYYPESLNATCNDIFAFAEEKGKIPVIGETGHTLGMSCEHCGHWFDEFLSVYNDPYSLCNKAAYAITWENYNTENFYIPLPPEKQFEGFFNFSISGEALFQHDPLWRDISVTDGYFSNRSTDHFEGSPTGGQVGGQSTGKNSGATTKVATDDVSGEDYIPSDDSVDTENSPDLSDDDTKGKASIQNSKTHASKTNNVADTDDGKTITVSCGKGCSETETVPTDSKNDDDDPLVADGMSNGTFTIPSEDDDGTKVRNDTVAQADTKEHNGRTKNKIVRKAAKEKVQVESHSSGKTLGKTKIAAMAATQGAF